MSFEEYMEEYYKEKEEKRLKYLDTFKSKICGDIETVYEAFLLLICKRYKMDSSYSIPNVAYNILQYFVENVDGLSFGEWIWCDDAPFVRKYSEIRKIFHEIPSTKKTSPYDFVKSVNNIYGLDLKVIEEYDAHYVYSFQFSFDSFTPLDVSEIIKLKNEITVLKKYGHSTGDLEEKLNGYGLSAEQIDKL